MLRLAFFKLAWVAALIVLLASIMGSAATAPVPEYDKSAEVKVKGVIEDVKVGTDKSIHLMLKNAKGPLEVIVAPEKFLKEMEIIFAKGDTIEVVGSPFLLDGNAVMLAREVTRDADVVTIRDEKGKPVWVGWIQ